MRNKSTTRSTTWKSYALMVTNGTIPIHSKLLWPLEVRLAVPFHRQFAPNVPGALTAGNSWKVGSLWHDWGTLQSAWQEYLGMVADGGFLNFGCEDSQISEGQKFREIMLKYRLGSNINTHTRLEDQVDWWVTPNGCMYRQWFLSQIDICGIFGQTQFGY